MDRAALVAALSNVMPSSLAEDLVGEFISIRQDVASGALGRAAPGKFVETVVQVLQHLEAGTFEEKPGVDAYLKGLESRNSGLDDDLRICASRLARAMYAFRNKRSILHKGAVDPNIYDLQLLHAGAQWTLAELLRHSTGAQMSQAGALIAQVQAPVGGLVEDFGDRRIVLHSGSATEEILVLLQSHYPTGMSRVEIVAAMDRRSPSTVRKALSQMWRAKQVEEISNGEFVLTQIGLGAAISILARVAS